MKILFNPVSTLVYVIKIDSIRSLDYTQQIEASKPDNPRYQHMRYVMSTPNKRKRNLIIAGILILAVLCIAFTAFYINVGPDIRCAFSSERQVERGLTVHTIQVDGEKRCYTLYTPPGYDPDNPPPVVFNYHGFGSNPISQSWISGWHDLADTEGFLVVTPQGTGFPQRWNSGSTWNANSADDVLFFREMLEDVTSFTPYDPGRVYVNGFSNGGGMTMRIACEATDKIAAVGTVAAAVVESLDCDPSGPLPLMAFHGTGDTVVNYEGFGMQYPLLRFGADVTHAPVYFYGAEEWTALWAENNGCDPTPVELPSFGDVSGVRYTSCNEDAEVIFYSIDGGGHTWPGGFPLLITGKTTSDIDATKEMWNFFQEYSLVEGD